MRPGVCFPSLAGAVLWDSTSFDAQYPAQNLADLRYPSRAARASGTGYASASFRFPQAAPIQFMALVNHNLGISATLRVRLYSQSVANTANTPVLDTGTVAVWPSGSAPVLGYAATRPLLFTAQVQAYSGILEVNDPAVKPQMGAVEVGAWWSWPGIGYGREAGFDARAPSLPLVGGGTRVEQEFAPRVVNGSIPFLALGALADTALDFQASADLSTPFVFVQDYDDPASWARFCFLATNTQVPPLTGAAYRHDRFQFRFAEHSR